MPRMMIVISDDDLHMLAVLARRRVAREGIDLARAYRKEAARLLAEKLEEVTHGNEVDTGTGEGDPTAAGTETAPAGGTGTAPGAEKLAG